VSAKDELAAKDARIAELEASIAENESRVQEIEDEYAARFRGARADGGEGQRPGEYGGWEDLRSRREQINDAFMDAIAGKRHGRAMGTRSSLTPKRKGKS
jgi:hypothetical protein